MKQLIAIIILSGTFLPIFAQFPGQPVFAPDGAGDDRFGNSVSLHGEYALIGAYYADKYYHTGAAYFFKRVNDSLFFHQKITEPEVQMYGYFGFSTDLNDKYAVVGAPHYSNPQGNGTVYIYNRSDDDWQRQSKFTYDKISGFGYSVAIDSNVVVVGAPFGPGLGAADSKQGEARIFQVIDDNGTEAWEEVATIAAGNGYDNGQFGYAVDISGNYIIAGGYPSSTFFPGRSACYVYEYENGSWIEKQRLFPEGVENTLSFGKCVSVYGETAAVGAPGEVNSDVVNGAVYIFERTNDGWIETARIVSPDSNTDYEEFGRSVDLYENRVIIGSRRAAYIYEKKEGRWELLDCTHRNSPNSGYYYYGYGSTVAIKDSVYLVGAYDEYHDDAVQGAAHIYELQKPVPASERDALVALYNSTDGPDWKVRYNWNTIIPVYQWPGIKVENGHVTEILLQSNRLNGHIPAEIGNLPELENLNFCYNELSGSVPPELGNCTKLITLDLMENQLSGDVPPSLGKLKLLQNLWLENNQLSGDLAGMFSNHQDLKYFGIGNNNFTGEVDLSKCTALKLCFVNNTLLRVLNVKNGNNLNITNPHFNASNNPELKCIIVDDAAFSLETWQRVDSTAMFVGSESECLSTSIPVASLPEINVFPNPTTGNLNVTLAGVADKISVFNTMGQLVLEKNDVRSIDLSFVPGGIYYVRIKSAEGYISTYEIIKK